MLDLEKTNPFTLHIDVHPTTVFGQETTQCTIKYDGENEKEDVVPILEWYVKRLKEETEQTKGSIKRTSAEVNLHKAFGLPKDK